MIKLRINPLEIKDLAIVETVNIR